MNTNTTSLSKISNILFLITTIFCLFFLWCNYYIKNIKTSLISSIIVILSFLIIYLPVYFIRQSKKTKTQLKSKEIKQLTQNLTYSQDAEILSLFLSILDKSQITEVLANNHIIMNNEDVFLLFNNNLIEQEFYKMLKCRKSNNIKIYCISKPNNITKITNITTSFIEINEIYQMFKSNNIRFKENIIIPDKQKFNLNIILNTVLNKSKSRSYLTLGILLLFTSLFTPFTNYYIIISTILIILSIISRFNTKFNIKK